MLLAGCATDDAPRPGVMEAKACVKSQGQALPDFEDLLIHYCTNNGVWVVSRLDPETRQQIEQFDFLNREYAGPETGFVTVQVETLTPERISAFYNLQKKMNGVLREGM